jgi:hypothetical protein
MICYDRGNDRIGAMTNGIYVVIYDLVEQQLLIRAMISETNAMVSHECIN